MAAGKEGTGRVVMRNRFGILNSYTLECSISGPTEGKLKGHHFGIPHFKEMGTDFCLSLFDYTSNLKKQEQTIDELR